MKMQIYVKFILLSRGIYIFFRIFSFNLTYFVIFLYNRNFFRCSLRVDLLFVVEKLTNNSKIQILSFSRVDLRVLWKCVMRTKFNGLERCNVPKLTNNYRNIETSRSSISSMNFWNKSWKPIDVICQPSL